MADGTGQYVKHHSFDGIVSNVSDPESQRRRMLDVLAPDRIDGSDPMVLAALDDLEKADDSAPLFRMTQHISDEASRLADDQLSRYLRHRYRYDVFPRSKTLDAYPPCLQIEPASVCNFRCVFCYQTDSTFARSADFMGVMPLDAFTTLVDQIEGHIDFVTLASRGEPFLNKSIAAMLEYCSGKFLGLKVNTNASLLEERHCHALLAGGVATLVFSADAAEEPLYGQLRVGGDLDTVLKNIERFRTIQATQYPDSNVITRVSGVRYGDGQDLESMVGLWGELVDQVCFVSYNPWENIYESPRTGVTTACSDLWRRMFIWYDGVANPCDSDYKSTLSVGNVVDQAVTDVWQSQRYEELRQRHAGGCRSGQEPCRRCAVV